MMHESGLSFVRASIGLAALLVALVLASPTRADDAIFPVGSRVGLVPPPGMVASDKFDGFADPAKDAAILIAILPPAAYPEITKSLDVDALRKKGLNIEKREPVQFSFGRGYVLFGRQTADNAKYRKWLLVAAANDFTTMVTVQVPDQDTVYSDKVIRAALDSLAIRQKVPEAEELGLLPFEVGDLAGFKVDDVLRGRAVMLSDQGAKNPADNPPAGDASAPGSAAHLLIAAVPGGPVDPENRANFARLAFNEISGIRDVHVSVSEPLRINGQSGYQTMAEAKDARTGTDVMVIQWLRFGGGGYLQMIGIAPSDHWTSVLARLRTVRDSVELR
jgi:hypothetical protein